MLVLAFFCLIDSFIPFNESCDHKMLSILLVSFRSDKNSGHSNYYP